jgi:hypothetical protein
MIAGEPVRCKPEFLVLAAASIATYLSSLRIALARPGNDLFGPEDVSTSKLQFWRRSLAIATRVFFTRLISLRSLSSNLILLPYRPRHFGDTFTFRFIERPKRAAFLMMEAGRRWS